MNQLNILSRLRTYQPPLWLSVWLALLALPVAQAGDDVYTWKDATGRVHYGNRPPEGQAATPIPVQPTERIYSWTDAEGKVHYGAHPPPDIQAREMKEDDGSLSTIHAGQLRSGEQQLLQQGR